MLKIANALFLLTLALSSFEALGQSRYRVEEYNKVKFLVPPKSKLNVKGDGGNVGSKYRYHFVTIKNLNNSYAGAVEEVEGADYYYHKSPGGRVYEVSAGDPFESGKVGGSDFCAVLYLNDQVILRIDYEEVLANHKTPYTVPRDRNEIIKMFNKLSVNLLEHFSQKEKDTVRPWPAGISQNIVEKVYELVPVPQPASLARYGMVVTKEKSFVLINPKIWLMVDNVGKSYIDIGSGSLPWQYTLQGQTLIQMNKGDDGSIIQAPFLILENKLSETKLPDNSTLQASTADIQLSNQLFQKKSIALYQEGFKRNHNMKDLFGACSRDSDLKNRECNSELLLFAAADNDFFKCLELFEPTKKCDDNPGITSSTFGLRNLITPVINIRLNAESRLVKLNSSLGLVSQTYDLPPVKKLKVYRKHRGQYRRVDGFDGDLLLLPNDKIRFEQ